MKKGRHQQDIRRIDAVIEKGGPQTPVNVFNSLRDSGRLMRHMTIQRVAMVMRRYYPKVGKAQYINAQGYKSGNQTSVLYGARTE